MVKMQKKGVSLVILIVLILVVSGCNSRRTDKGSSSNREIDYRTGTDGLELVLPVDTPTEIYEGDRDVRFLVEVRNKGAFPQSDEIGNFGGKLWIGGYDENILTIYPRIGTSISQGVELVGNELEGKSPYNEEGGYSAIEFRIDARTLPEGVPSYNPKLIITASYFYQTIANPVVCIDPEPRSTRIREKICDIDDSISVGSQGGPITITKVEQDVTSNDFLFKIYISNDGDGLVIRKGDIGNNPNEGSDRRELDNVKLEDVSAGNVRMTQCRPSIGSDVHLIEDKGYIFCRLDKTVAAEKTYETPLNIRLSYGYTSSVEKEIKVFEEVLFS